jgi:hypothetical protein
VNEGAGGGEDATVVSGDAGEEVGSEEEGATTGEAETEESILVASDEDGAAKDVEGGGDEPVTEVAILVASDEPGAPEGVGGGGEEDGGGARGGDESMVEDI